MSLSALNPFRTAPWKPLASREDVLCAPCSCGALPGQECDLGAFPSFLGMLMPEMSGVHTRRYLNWTEDPR